MVSYGSCPDRRRAHVPLWRLLPRPSKVLRCPFHAPTTDHQLMELAGLSCAQALYRTFPPTSHPRVIVCCGPGNQGGDGLVAARHLRHFRYTPTVYLPKPGGKDIYQRLLRQCENLGVGVIKEIKDFERGLGESDVVLDAIFGGSGDRPPTARLAGIPPRMDARRGYR